MWQPAAWPMSDPSLHDWESAVEPMEIMGCDENTLVLDKNGVVPVLYGKHDPGPRLKEETIEI